MFSASFRIFIISLLLFSLSACTKIKDKPLADLVFIITDAYPESERNITQQTEEYRSFVEDLSMMDSVDYVERIDQLEECRSRALESLKSGIRKTETLSETDGENHIKDATLTFLGELLAFEVELGSVLTSGKTAFNRSAFMTEVFEMYSKHDLKSKGEVFVDKQRDFMREFNITQNDIDKAIAES